MGRKNRKVCGVHDYQWVFSVKLQKPVRRVKAFNPCGKDTKAKLIDKSAGRKLIRGLIKKGKLPDTNMTKKKK